MNPLSGSQLKSADIFVVRHLKWAYHPLQNHSLECHIHSLEMWALSFCSFACLPFSAFQSLFRLFSRSCSPGLIWFVQSHTEEMMFEIVAVKCRQIPLVKLVGQRGFHLLQHWPLPKQWSNKGLWTS